MKTLRTLALMASVVALAACDKDAVQISSITAPISGARVKFFNFGLNAPGVNFYAGNNKVTAVSSTTGVESTTGVAFGAVAAGNLYTALPAGQVTFAGKIAATIDKDVTVATVPATLADGKAYSVYVSGFYDATTKQVEGFVVEDAFTDTYDFTQALVRFVNASPNSTPMQLFLRNATSLVESSVGNAVAYKAGGAFVAVPAGGYELNTRTVGSGVNAITRTAVSFLAGRVYTVTARGDMTIVSTTLANRPFLDNSLNR